MHKIDQSSADAHKMYYIRNGFLYTFKTLTKEVIYKLLLAKSLLSFHYCCCIISSIILVVVIDIIIIYNLFRYVRWKRTYTKATAMFTHSLPSLSQSYSCISDQRHWYISLSHLQREHYNSSGWCIGSASIFPCQSAT